MRYEHESWIDFHNVDYTSHSHTPLSLTLHLNFARGHRAFFAEWDFLICPSYSMAAFPKDESMPMEDRILLLDGTKIPYWKSQFWPILTNTAVRKHS